MLQEPDEFHWSRGRSGRPHDVSWFEYVASLEQIHEGIAAVMPGLGRVRYDVLHRQYTAVQATADAHLVTSRANRILAHHLGGWTASG